MRGPWGCHLMRAFRAVFDSIRATPSVCGGFSPSWPENNSVSPEASNFSPLLIHLASLMPRMSSLYALISAATWAVFPISYMVFTFHVPILMVALVESMVVGKVASLRLSPIRVIHLPAGDPSSPRAELVVRFFVSVSVAYRVFFLQRWAANPSSNPPPFPGLGPAYVGVPAYGGVCRCWFELQVSLL